MKLTISELNVMKLLIAGKRVPKNFDREIASLAYKVSEKLADAIADSNRAMITRRFKLESDAKSFCRQLEDEYRIGMYYHRGHHEYCVQYYDVKSDEELYQLGEV